MMNTIRRSFTECLVTKLYLAVSPTSDDVFYSSVLTASIDHYPAATAASVFSIAVRFCSCY